MVSAATGRSNSKGHPSVAIIVGVPVNSIGADGRIRGKSASGFLVCPQDWIQTGVGCNIRFVFPERLAAFRLSWTQAFRQSQSPDRSGIHCHDPAAVRIKANIEL